MSDSKSKMSLLIKRSIQAYLLIAIWIFTPYLNWKYANENGFVKWLFLGEIISTMNAFIWPYHIYNIYYDDSDANYPKWPDMTASEKERVRATVFYKIATNNRLTTEDINEYRSAMMEYSKRVGRKFTAQDALIFTHAFDLLYSYRNEYGKSMLESLNKEKPIFTSEYDNAKAKLLKARIIDIDRVEEDIQLLTRAAKGEIYVDPNGVSHYPPTREHILSVIEKDKILKENIEILKELHYQMASDKM